MNTVVLITKQYIYNKKSLSEKLYTGDVKAENKRIQSLNFTTLKSKIRRNKK